MYFVFPVVSRRCRRDTAGESGPVPSSCYRCLPLALLLQAGEWCGCVKTLGDALPQVHTQRTSHLVTLQLQLNGWPLLYLPASPPHAPASQPRLASAQKSGFTSSQCGHCTVQASHLHRACPPRLLPACLETMSWSGWGNVVSRLQPHLPWWGLNPIFGEGFPFQIRPWLGPSPQGSL